MKKLIATLSVAMLLITKGNIYPQSFVVTEVDTLPDYSAVLIMESRDGNIWQVDGDGDCEPGQILNAIMFDGFTPDDLTDDTILSLRWSGWCID